MEASLNPDSKKEEDLQSTLETTSPEKSEPTEEYISPYIKSCITEEKYITQNRKGVVVLQPGSFNLRFGYAESEDRRPASISHCIAYRRDIALADLPSPPSTPQNSSTNDVQSMETDSKVDQTVESSNGLLSPFSDPIYDEELKEIEQKFDYLSKDLERTNKNSSVRYLNQDNCFEVLPEDNASTTEWADIQRLPDHLIGDQALYLDDLDPYDIFFPIKHGRFNYECCHMTSSTNRFQITKTMIVDSLYRIWNHVVRERLDIKAEETARYDVMLIIPDSFEQDEVHQMIEILINQIGFGHIMIQKESVCAALGAGKNGCCVVNIGFSTTTVACVDDMEVLEGSSFTIERGGLDVSKFLKDLLVRNSQTNFFKYQQAQLDSSIQDLIIFEEMKESSCHLNTDLVKPKMYEFLVRHRDSPTQLYRLDIGMAQFFAPMVLCYNSLDKYRNEKMANRRYTYETNSQLNPNTLDELDETEGNNRMVHKPHDYWSGEFYRPVKPFQAHVSKRMKKTAATPAVPAAPAQSLTGMDVDQQDAMALPSEQLKDINAIVEKQDKTEEEWLKLFELKLLRLVTPDENTKHHLVDLSLAHAVIASIMSATSIPRFQNRLFSHVLLVGGSSTIQGLKELLESDIYDLLPNLAQNTNVFSPSSGTNGATCAWSGGVLLVTQTPRDFWLDKISWRNHGLLALREKLLFSWDNPKNRKVK